MLFSPGLAATALFQIKLCLFQTVGVSLLMLIRNSAWREEIQKSSSIETLLSTSKVLENKEKSFSCVCVPGSAVLLVSVFYLFAVHNRRRTAGRSSEKHPDQCTDLDPAGRDVGRARQGAVPREHHQIQHWLQGVRVSEH